MDLRVVIFALATVIVLTLLLDLADAYDDLTARFARLESRAWFELRPEGGDDGK